MLSLGVCRCINCRDALRNQQDKSLNIYNNLSAIASFSICLLLQIIWELVSVTQVEFGQVTVMINDIILTEI